MYSEDYKLVTLKDREYLLQKSVELLNKVSVFFSLFCDVFRNGLESRKQENIHKGVLFVRHLPWLFYLFIYRQTSLLAMLGFVYFQIGTKILLTRKLNPQVREYMDRICDYNKYT